MRLVIVESPYAGDIPRNTRYARAALADCLRRGEAPFASHLLYTQPGVLRDSEPAERYLGITAGFAWAHKADLTVLYLDLGMSTGMEMGLEDALLAGRPVEERRLGGEWGEVEYLQASLKRSLREEMKPEPSKLWNGGSHW